MEVQDLVSVVTWRIQADGGSLNIVDEVPSIVDEVPSIVLFVHSCLSDSIDYVCVYERVYFR